MARQGKRWDGSLAGNNFRLKRGEDTPAYRKIGRRSEGVPFQDISNNRGQFSTRGDTRAVFQTSWARGSFWNKPLLSDTSMDTYFTSEGFDLVTEPGNMVAMPDSAQQASSDVHLNPLAIQVAHDEIYYPENSGTNQGLVQWTGSAFSVLTNDTSIDTQTPVGMCWDSGNNTVFVLFDDGNVGYVTPDSAGGLVIDLSADAAIDAIYPGATIFMHFGRLFAWTGELLVEIKTPLATASLDTSIYNDGMGPDMADEITANATDPTNPRSTIRLAVPSSEGIWLVKNIHQEGVTTPFITRVDRTNDGTNVGIPVASLPPNTMVLDVAYHLGGLVLATASNMQRVFDNDISASGYPEITLYSLINGQLTTIGSPLGGIAPDEAPYRLLANDRAKMYIGGNKSVWVYDAVRGGIHKWMENTYAAAAGGTFMSMVFTTSSAGDEVQQFSHYGSATVIQQPTKAEGGGSTTHSLESNYFDFNIPAESKTITHVTLMTDGVGAGETWTISLETDDSAFASVATATSTTANTAKQRLSTVKTGFRFRYKLVWTGSDIASPSKVKGIVFHALQGEMVTQWVLSVDGTEFLNVENQVVRPDDVLTYLETIAGTATVVAFVDEYRTASSSHNVKVESVTVERSAPQEIDSAQIILTEDT